MIVPNNMTHTTPITPLVAADTIIELTDRSDHPIVLIERRNPPFGWALPGGFVDVGETVEQAAIREAMEETSLVVTLQCLLGCYSEPSRDVRGHTVSLVYLGQAEGTPQAQDDAREVSIFAPQNLPKRLAFDHAYILKDYLTLRETGKLPALRQS